MNMTINHSLLGSKTHLVLFAEGDPFLIKTHIGQRETCYYMICHCLFTFFCSKQISLLSIKVTGCHKAAFQ